jgi:hypothetical protein
MNVTVITAAPPAMPICVISPGAPGAAAVAMIEADRVSARLMVKFRGPGVAEIVGSPEIVVSPKTVYSQSTLFL